MKMYLRIECLLLLLFHLNVTLYLCDDQLSTESTDLINEIDLEALEESENEVVDVIELKNFTSNKLIAYVKSWEESEFTNMIGSSITHGIFAFADLDSDGTVSIPNERLPKLVQMLYSRSELEAVGHSLKVLVSIGGGDNSQYFSHYVKPDSRQTLITSIINFMVEFNLDGIEIDWQGVESGDKDNYVNFINDLKVQIDDLQMRNNRTNNYILTITAPIDQSSIEKGFDLPKLSKSIDWFTLMTHDFNSEVEDEGKSTLGSPIFNSVGATNSSIDSVVNYYVCNLKEGGLNDEEATSKLIISVPFFGRVFYNTSSTEGRKYSRKVSNVTNGDVLTFEQVFQIWKNKGQHYWDEDTYSAYAIDNDEILLYETEDSLEAKVAYIKIHKLAGLAIWSIEDDSDDNDLLDFVSNVTLAIVDQFENYTCLCNEGKEKNFNETNVTEKELKDPWWKVDSPFPGMCGFYAPLINGYYAICNPNDEKYYCCSKYGYCGSGDDFCKSEGSIDFRNNQHLLNNESMKATKEVTWHLITSTVVKPGQPRCGPKAPKLNNDQEATCNPDDPSAYCCSPYGFCGIGDDYCNCKGCINYKK